MINEFTQLISTVGFPIAACIVVYLQSCKQDRQIQDLTEKVMGVLDRNTDALAKFTQKLECMEDRR